MTKIRPVKLKVLCKLEIPKKDLKERFERILLKATNPQKEPKREILANTLKIFLESNHNTWSMIFQQKYAL